MSLRTTEQLFSGPVYACPDEACWNAVLHPSDKLVAELKEQGKRRGTITITHTRADGTLLEGSRKGDGVFELVRPHRFWFSRSMPGTLFIRQSRDKRADHWSIRRAAEALRKAGWTVEITIDEDTRRSFAEAEADRVTRAEERTERFTEYAGNAAARSNTAYAGVRQIADGIPMGQPLMPDHHSYRRALRDRERMDAGMRRSIDEGKKAEYYTQRAKASGSYEVFRKNPPRALRRIEKLEAELRGVERWLRGESNNGYTRALTPDTVAELGRRKEELEEEIGYWRHVIAEAEANGFKVWRPDDFVKGDFAKVYGRWFQVLRVNKKTLTVPSILNVHQAVVTPQNSTYGEMTHTVPYDKVFGRRSAEEMERTLAEASSS
ncbi:hypothetical protein AVL59_32705 [Streptomyces griseochromogenes]|nr:hypothetical protein AVL59_32705 [Streptomyces griseochromogenes]